MPNWSDENGRFWWLPPGKLWHEAIEIPHPPIALPKKGCKCQACTCERKRSRKKKQQH